LKISDIIFSFISNFYFEHFSKRFIHRLSFLLLCNILVCFHIFMSFDTWDCVKFGEHYESIFYSGYPLATIPIGGIACLMVFGFWLLFFFFFFYFLVILCKFHSSPFRIIYLLVNFDFVLVAITEQPFKGVKLI
jgi:hypothetical protein